MASGYVSLPGYDYPRNALLDFSPVSNGLTGLSKGLDNAYAMETNKQVGSALAKGDYKGAAASAYGRGDLQTGLQATDLGQKADDRLKTKFANLAFMALSERDPTKRASMWQRTTDLHPDIKSLDPRYMDPETGPLMLIADAGKSSDWLDYQLKQKTAAIQAAAEGRAQQLFPGQLEAQRTGNALNAEKLDEAQNPQKAFEKRAAMAGQYGLQPGTADYQHFVLNGKLPDHSSMNKFGLNPVWGKDENGNDVLLQVGTQGNAVQTQIPPGIKLSSGVDKVDLGTQWGFINKKTGELVGTQPKDIVGKERQEQIGQAQGKAAADLPRVEGIKDRILGVLDGIEKDTNLDSVTGWQANLPTLLSRSHDTEARIAQLKGNAFLQAFESLKGAGQITEVEGAKATDALARLSNLKQTDAGYRKALSDFRGEVLRLYEIAKRRAGQNAGASAPDPLGIR